MQQRLLVPLLWLALAAAAPAALAADKPPATPPKPAPYTGLKKRLAVMPIELKTTVQVNGTTVRESGDKGPGNIGSAMTEQLTTALVNTGRFVVLERKALADVQQEQQLAQSGQVNPATAPQPGMLIGAEWLITAAITEYESKSSRSIGGLVLGNLGLGGRKSTAKVVMDVRIIDATTGEVLDSVKASGDAKSTGAIGGLAVKGVVVAGGKEDNTPIGQATRTALATAVQFICDRMESLPWRGRVVTVEGQDVIINAGAKANVRVGDRFDVYSLGKKLIDPDTGKVLGQRESRGGTIEVTEVQEKIAICRVVTPPMPVDGDVIKPLTQPSAPEPAALPAK